jgi:hypothetical protein
MKSTSVLLYALLPVALVAQEARDVVQLKNWTTPLHWQPHRVEGEATAKPAPQLQFSGSAVSPDALTFVAVTPCRLVDTRGIAAGFNGNQPFGGPSIAGAGTATFPVQIASEATADTAPAPCGVIPSIAEAYSFNVTVIPHGGGVVGYLSIWPAGSAQPAVATLNDREGVVIANAAIVPAGTPNGGVSVYNAGPATIDLVIDMNGFFTAPSDLNGNTAIGAGALASNTTGGGNTASGFEALQSNTTASFSTALGAGALFSSTGGENTAIGNSALFGNTIGNHNLAAGSGALEYNTTGAGNIALGVTAGNTAPPGNSNSIYIGSLGTANDLSGTIQIGTQGTQTGGTFIAGISGATSSSGTEVLVNSSGQLGTMLSSRRFKEEITDMADTSDKLLQLHPVTFYYKPEYDDGSHLLQYGLIAEEVAKVYPELVAYDKDGRILSVQYQKLTPMLLNELQKQDEQIRSLERRLAALEALQPTAPTPAP